MQPANSAPLHHLRTLSYRFPTADAALSEIAHLRAVLELPRGNVHVVSDVHGEHHKLNHILRNASGGLRPRVEALFRDRLDASAQIRLLGFVYYPRESFAFHIEKTPDPAQREAEVRNVLTWQFELMRVLASSYTLRHAERLFPAPHALLFRELLLSPVIHRDPQYLRALLDPFLSHDGGLDLLRAVSHTVRAFSVFELIVAGDLGDRGPRLDKVIDLLRHQRNLTITWGNHDAAWMGACLGQEALIATVLRVSLRYGRIAQLEEGYGIPVEPIEQLAREVYSDDPAERFSPKGDDLRDPLLLARMQKAIAVIQFKLEAQTSQRNPQFGLESRNLLHRMDLAAGTVEIDGVVHPLRDKLFPTVDPKDPYTLTAAEARCIRLMREAFTESAALWRDMQFVADRGTMLTTRDENVIFHGCVPVTAEGEPLELEVNGAPYKGRALFEALDTTVRRAFRTRTSQDTDVLYYLWAGPRSPLFGKDRMATFETYFVEDKSTHKETKNPYFSLIHTREFCVRMARELGVDAAEPLLVNGHVPVKLEQGESPVKKGGLAVTIDGAFSEAYGDKGYTLVIDSGRTYLAQHHHFGSIEQAIATGDDIIPTIQDVRTHAQVRRVKDTDRGKEIEREMEDLDQLIAAYRDRKIVPPIV